jgi:tetratricopeptide (TPR) repeat protein
LVDEDARRRFEACWRHGQPAPIEQFLPPDDHPLYLATLEELVHIELEFAWKPQRHDTAAKGTTLRVPLLVEAYLARFPQLNDPAIVLRLLQQERRVRRRSGEDPSLDEYRARFPSLGTEGLEEDTLPADNSAALRPMAIPGYEVLGELGRGGMGMVLRARDPTLARDLAIKVLLKQHAGNPAVVGRFRKEARVTGQLQHPGVVPVYALGQYGDEQPYFTMKLVQGVTLAELLRARKDPARNRPGLLRVFEAVCQAVAYAHAKHIIHRDLKPQNVMVGAFGEVQVMDWGLAKVLRTESVVGFQFSVVSPDRTTSLLTTENRQLTTEGTQAGDVLGTPAYMSPEQARGEVERLDERSDVFSLGAILCEVLTGQAPYTGGLQSLLRQAQQAALADALARLDGCGADGELIALARRCLAPEPKERPRDAGEVARQVEAYRAGVEERARRAELERAAALAREEEARATAREAEAREAAEKRQAEEAEARAEAERRRADESERRVTAERRARRLTVGLAAAALVLVVAGGGAAWVWQQRRATADAQTRLALEQGRSRLKDGWESSDVAKLEAAATEADKALKLAQNGAGETLRQEAEDLHAEAGTKLEQARRNADLLVALLDVIAPREPKPHAPGPSGVSRAVAEPDAEGQFARAFRRWDEDRDFDRTSVGALVSRLGEQPESVVREVVAGLDTWMLERRARQRPGAPWRRLFQVAEGLDRDEDSRALRRALVSGELEREAAARALARRLPGLARVALPPGEQTRRLRQQAAEAARSRPPVLRVVTLARALVWVGDVEEATQLLRAAVIGQPDRVVLLAALGQLLELQGPARRREAIECYQAVRALRPGWGFRLGIALAEDGRLAEAEDVLVELRRRQPDAPNASLNLGNVLYHRGKLAEAEAAFRRAIALQPDSAAAHANLGGVLHDRNRLAEAEAVCRKAVELRPDFAAAHGNLGNVLHARKKLAEAEAACRKAAELQPDLPGADYNLGIVLYDRGKLAEAEAAFRRAIARQPDNAEAHNNLGLVLRDQNKLAEAEAACRRALEIRPGSALAHSTLGAVLWKRGKLAEAETACRRAVELGPRYAPAHGNLGLVLRARNKLAEAEGACRRAVELQPDFPPGFSNLGGVLHERGKLREAEVAYRKALELQPGFAEGYVGLGLVLRALKRLAEAEAAYRRATELRPDHADAHLKLGLTLYDQKKLAEAEAVYHKALELRPGYAEAHTNLGLVLHARKRLAEAEAAHRRAIALKPGLAEAYSNLGLVLAERNRLTEAEAALRRAVELRPGDALAHSNLGNILARQKKLAEAEAAHRKAVELRPDLALAHFNFGDVLHDRGKLAEAEAAFRRATELQPDLAAAHNSLGVVLRDRRRPAEAEAAFRKAIALQPDLAPPHANLGLVLRDGGRLREALTAFRRAARLMPGHPGIRANLEQTERLVELDSRLDAVRAGKARPKDARERLDLGLLCGDFKRQYAAAATFFADAFAADPKLAADLRVPHRLTAARYAALAAAGEGEDAGKLSDQQRSRLRKQALGWLRADLDAHAPLADKPDSRVLVRQRLTFWLKDEALAGVRDEKKLATLPEAERKEWRKLWADVAALLKK